MQQLGRERRKAEGGEAHRASDRTRSILLQPSPFRSSFLLLLSSQNAVLLPRRAAPRVFSTPSPSTIVYLHRENTSEKTSRRPVPFLCSSSELSFFLPPSPDLLTHLVPTLVDVNTVVPTTGTLNVRTLVLVESETTMLPLTESAKVNSSKEVEREGVKDVKVDVLGMRSVNKDEEKTVEVASGVCRR